MPDFLPILIIGIICFVAFLIVFGGGIFTTTPSRSRSIYLPEDRTIDVGSFSVYYTVSEGKVGHVDGEVSSGIFSNEEKRIGFSVSNPEEASEAFLDLKVWQSNYYGRFVVLVNGKEVYADYPPVGEKLIGFDTSVLKKDNILEIKADSSGWRIWAPTVYTFDSDVIINYLGRKTKSFNFELSKLETDNMEKARVVVFGERKGTGDLDIMINGVNIFSGVTTVYKDFSVDNLRTGNNTISFSTEANTTYDISTAQIILFFE